NDTRIPVLGSFLTVAANLGFINLTLGPLQHRAIALSTSLSVTLNFFFLALMLYRKLGGFRAGYLLRTLAKTGGAALVMGLAVFWTYPLLIVWLGSGLPGRLLSLLGDILLGGGIYVLLVWRFKIPEFQELTRQLAARLKR
ncbi:MAG: polysaccharide biosynthesis C-terminal domain-containing protein, partial [Desulfobaccales bacterium]